MPAFLSLPEAARCYRLSEKTLHNWIDKGWLQANKARINGRMQYLIDPTQLEQLIEVRNMLQARASMSQNDLGFATRLEALEHRVSELEASQHEIHTLPATPIPQPQNKPSRIHHANPDKISNPLPDGYVSFFAFQHGIPDTSAGRWKREQPATLVQEGVWHGASGHQIKVALTPDGQRAYYLWAKDRPGFTTCDLCPHVPKLD